ncbi:hypothetical protein [Flavobacterium sp.]|uniref:hypothetical protein n=1 Tax=Flavobacterium sp. TaxID=239 RepID=UPI0028BF4856|nr:hypothetical protein [Flavobacterium sp.]
MKREKLLFLTLLFFFGVSICFSQVGIGTTNPLAKLDIDATSDAIPAFAIRPVVSAPTGTSDGQIAMIDNSLYFYDNTRTKWLSSETVALNYSNSGDTDDEYLNSNSVNSGIRIPYNATLIAITARASGGDTSRQFRVRKNGSTTNLLSFTVTTFNYSSTTQNLNFDAGDFINIYVDNESGDITNPTVTLWLKWRK